MYRIRNPFNGHVYIGITQDFPSRTAAHLRPSSCRPRMRTDLLHYGPKAFVCSVLDVVPTLTRAHLLEETYITLQAGLHWYNTVMEGAPTHSQRVWGIRRAAGK